VVPESNMPTYGFLRENDLNAGDMRDDLRVNTEVGVPYTQAQIDAADDDLRAQADPNVDASGLRQRYAKVQVRDFDGQPDRLTEMDALIAYLQMLGTLVDFDSARAQEVDR